MASRLRTDPDVRRAGSALFLTLPLDVAFLLAPALLVRWPGAGLLTLAGLLALAFTLARLWRLEGEGVLCLPAAWFLGAALTPFSALLAVVRGAWQGRSGARSRSLAFRTGASMILVLLALIPWLPAVADYPQRSGLGAVQGEARAYLQSATLKAVATFAAARGLNAAISTLQESSLSVGVGVSGNLALGQVLDPLNDLVERFSEVMLISSVALGLQQLLLPMGLWLGGSVLWPAALVCLLAAVWLGWPGGQWIAGLGRRLLVAAAVVWLAVPLAAGVGSSVFERFLADRYQEAAATIEATEHQGRLVEARVPEDADAGWWQSLGLDRLDLRARIGALTERAEAAVHSVIELTVIFLFQTVALPLATLWVLARLAGLLVRSPLPSV